MVCPGRDTFFVHEGPRRNTKNCNGNTFVHGGHGGPRRTATATATSFCPRRAAKEHEELQRQHICPRRTRRAAENCNGHDEGTRRTTSFCPRRTRRAAKVHDRDEELQRQHICPRRTRRAAENCNGDCNFLLSTKGREGTRRTATATHLSTEDTEGRGELQRRLQLPFVHEGPRRNTKNCNGNTFVHGGHGGPRRTATATATSFCPRRAAKEHEELQRQHIWSTEDTEGRGELQRRLQLPFVHEGPRRATKNCNGNTFVHGGHGGPRRTATATATSFCPRRAAKGHEENLCQVIIWSVHEGTRRTPYVVDADHGRRSRESGEKRSDCARRRPVFVTL